MYPQLRILPEHVLLVPGAIIDAFMYALIELGSFVAAEFQVESVGWPSGDAIALTFQLANATVAHVNADGLVHALAIGETNLTAQAEVRLPVVGI